jgi:flagellin
LGQVSKLLNDIRGLVTEAANQGAMSDEQIAANQLQVDSSLEAIDRIAQTTTFQGRKLLDGSLGFLVSGGTGYSTVSDLSVNKANLGASGSMSVAVDITAAATTAQITNAIPDSATGQFTLGTRNFTITSAAAANLDTVTVAIAKNSGAEATGAVTIQGHEFTITAASGQSGVDAVTVTTATGDNVARGTVTIDDSTFGITAKAGTNIDNVTVAVAKSDLGLAQNSAMVTINDTNSNVTFDSIQVKAGIANLSTRETITLAFTNAAAADGANFNTSNNTLTININSGDTANRSAATIGGLINDATVNGNTVVGGTFVTVANSGNVNAGVGAITNGTLSQVKAQAAYDGGTNKLTITLNSNTEATVTASAVESAVEAVTSQFDGTSVTIGGATNIIAANVTAGDIGTLTRPGVLATYTDGVPDTLLLTFDSKQSQIALSEVTDAIDDLTEFEGTSTTSSTGTINGVSFTTATTAAALNRLTTGVAARFNTTSNTLTLTFDGSNQAVAHTAVITAIDALTQFDNTTSSGSGTIDASELTDTSSLATAGRVQDLVVRIAGELGSEVFTFEAGTTFAQIADAIQSVSDATGVAASVTGSNLVLTSTNYGSKSFVDVEVISEGTGGTFKDNLSAERDAGSDIVATVNGVQAQGDRNTLSVNTATLDISMTVADASTTDVAFTITGGGALFQLGPSVVSNQQARMGIDSIATGSLGGMYGRLYELRAGNSAALNTDPTVATRIVDEAITAVVELRGRLGSFQRTSLETNIASLEDTMVNLTDAESAIRDADFAKESAALTRGQILVQSGTAVLAIANQNPQNVLSLLR